MKKAIFSHAGCVEADRVAEAETAGVQSVPALVFDGQAFHMNFGASMADVKGTA